MPKGKLWIYYVDMWREDGTKTTARIRCTSPSNAMRKVIEKVAVPNGMQDITKMEVKPNPLPADQYERRKLLKEKRQHVGKFDINLSL